MRPSSPHENSRGSMGCIPPFLIAIYLICCRVYLLLLISVIHSGFKSIVQANNPKVSLWTSRSCHSILFQNKKDSYTNKIMNLELTNAKKSLLYLYAVETNIVLSSCNYYANSSSIIVLTSAQNNGFNKELNSSHHLFWLVNYETQQQIWQCC